MFCNTYLSRGKDAEREETTVKVKLLKYIDKSVFLSLNLYILLKNMWTKSGKCAMISS